MATEPSGIDNTQKIPTDEPPRSINSDETHNNVLVAAGATLTQPSAVAETTVSMPPPAQQPAMQLPASKGPRGVGGKRSRSTSPPPPVLDAVTQAALAQAAQQCQAGDWKGLGSLLISSMTATTATTATQHGIPTVAAVRTAALKAIQDSPPWVHWSKTDMAPQLKCIDTPLKMLDNSTITSRLTVTASAMRGYRMARASHGVSNTTGLYFECKLLPGPSAEEIYAALPPNARLGPTLQNNLDLALQWEKEQKKTSNKRKSETEETAEPEEKRQKTDNDTVTENAPHKPPPKVGGNVRLGWAMRTGDLQAPVGYDKWSYGIRDTAGSILHESNRQDTWGGDHLEEGDIVGCAIVLDPDDESENHIRFFKNGRCMGNFVMSKGKRVGGEAFAEIASGMYYPAASSYMGGTVQANFGPHFVCPPRKVPAGLKFKPFSDICPPPLSPGEAVEKISATAKLFRKPEQVQALKDAVAAEAEILCTAYESFMKSHVDFVRQEREERGLSTSDLQQDD